MNKNHKKMKDARHRALMAEYKMNREGSRKFRENMITLLERQLAGDTAGISFDGNHIPGYVMEGADISWPDDAMDMGIIGVYFAMFHTPILNKPELVCFGLDRQGHEFLDVKKARALEAKSEYLIPFTEAIDMMDKRPLNCVAGCNQGDTIRLTVTEAKDGSVLMHCVGGPTHETNKRVGETCRNAILEVYREIVANPTPYLQPPEE